MDLKQFIQILKRRWFTVFIVVFLALGASVAISTQTTPQFQSQARVFISADINNSTEAYGLSLYTGGRVESYADLATSTSLMRQVIDSIGLSQSPEDLAEDIDAEVLEGTFIIEITAQDPDAQRAQSIAQATAQRLTEFISDLEAPVDGGDSPITATITNPANFDDTQVSPRTALNLVVAVLIGLILGVGLALTRQILDRTITSQEHLEELTEAPVLAKVGSDKDVKAKPLLTDLGPFASRTEAFRLLRTNLQFLDLDAQPRSLVITSAVPGEGKTMTSTNLAVALAQTGRRVLVLDCDLRRPRVAGVLGLDDAVGLTTVLLGNSSVEDAIQIHEPSGLHFLGSGAKPPNPTEILQSRVTRDLIDGLVSDYDMVIIDAPPLLPVADASVLSTLADGTILVVKHGSTTRDQFADALGGLNQVGSRLFGIVVNQIPRRSANAYYYYYYEETPAKRRT